MGEGASPLIALPDVADKLGAAEVWLKYEAVNPTHSFKDRANSVAVTLARHFGFEKVMCTSTGNHGVALAAYAARAGLRCLILLPPGAPPIAVTEMRFFGADVVTVEGPGIIQLMTDLWQNHGWYMSQRNAAGVGGRAFGNPFSMEGYKTLSYEVFHQLGRRVPDRIFAPVGGGDGAWGFYKGFRELKELGLSEQVPELIACQSSAGGPLELACRANLAHVAPVPTAPTIAFSIVDSQTGDHALMAIRESGGTAVGVDDAALRRAEETLARSGICVEPSSAAALAGLHALVERGESVEGQVIVLVGTGAGLRWPATFDTALDGGRISEASVDALGQLVTL
jgi:threonine synthase